MISLYSEDPANWDRSNESLIEHLMLNPPKNNLHLINQQQFCSTNVAGAKKRGRSLSKEVFYRKLVNGEKQLRDWLIYSPQNQSLYCFPCFLVGNSQSGLGQATGFCNWKNTHQCMKEHEQSADHRLSVTTLVNRSRAE